MVSSIISNNPLRIYIKNVYYLNIVQLDQSMKENIVVTNDSNFIYGHSIRNYHYFLQEFLFTDFYFYSEKKRGFPYGLIKPPRNIPLLVLLIFEKYIFF